MKSIYLIHANTPRAIALLEEEGAIRFSSDTFLWNSDPLSMQRFNEAGKDVLVGEFTVLDIFVPNKPNSIRYEHENKEELKELMSELHQAAFHWQR